MRYNDCLSLPTGFSVEGQCQLCISGLDVVERRYSVLDLALEDARRLLQRFQLLGAGRRYRKQTRKHAETDENTDDENRQADTAVGGCW